MDKVNDIIYITNTDNSKNVFSDNCVWNIDILKKEVEQNLSSNHEIDDFYHIICNRLSKHKDAKGILIDFDLKGYDVFAIVHHIRLSQNIRLHRIPIIITHNEYIVISKLKYQNIDDLGLFKTKGACFELYINLFQYDKLSDKYRIYEIIEMFEREFDYSYYLKSIKLLSPETTSSHQIANEWGAFKLAHEAGYDISYSLPKTLYFKYLKSKFSSKTQVHQKEQTTLFNKKLNVLLVDDNYDKGWKEALMKILPAEIISYKNILDVLSDIVSDNGEQYNKYDLVLLDLYMPTNEGKMEIETSVDFLEKLKEFNPSVPIIVFTASNKVWNLQKLAKLGADGYFVKESPENANIPNFSLDNYSSFRETIGKAVDKGGILKKYWKTITIIKENYLALIEDGGNTKFRSRINERLNMFFGLLKRGMEQSEFNQKHFYFSDYELAFMTLWSVLNEVQEAYYQKNHYSEQLIFLHENRTILKHPNGNNIIPIPGYNWKIKNQSDFLIEHKFELVKENGRIKQSKGFYKLISISFSSHIKLSKGEPFFEYSINSNNKNVSRELFNQIAFLILKKKELKDDVRKMLFLGKLKKLNDIRNHLYLTHGDMVNKEFYSKTEESKRDTRGYNITPYGDIKGLFKLVSFLLIGNKSIEIDEILDSL